MTHTPRGLPCSGFRESTNNRQDRPGAEDSTRGPTADCRPGSDLTRRGEKNLIRDSVGPTFADLSDQTYPGQRYFKVGTEVLTFRILGNSRIGIFYRIRRCPASPGSGVPPV